MKTSRKPKIKPSVFTVQEFADKAQIPLWTAYELIRRGEVPVIRLGKHIRVTHRAFDELEAS